MYAEDYSQRITICTGTLTALVLFHVSLANQLPSSTSNTLADWVMINMYALNFMSWLVSLLPGRPSLVHSALRRPHSGVNLKAMLKRPVDSDSPGRCCLQQTAAAAKDAVRDQPEFITVGLWIACWARTLAPRRTTAFGLLVGFALSDQIVQKYGRPLAGLSEFLSGRARARVEEIQGPEAS